MEKTRANQLQFLRFIAFLLICMVHTESYQPSWGPGGNGAINAVAFFIILSGAVSGYSSYNKDIECSFKGILLYMWKKIKKVYPLYFITTLIAVIYTDIPGLIAANEFAQTKSSVIQLLKNIFLIQSWFPENYFSYNGVGWFLSTIMFLYITNIPLRAMAGKIRRLKNSDYIFAGVFIVTFACVIVYCYFTQNTNTEYTQYILPVSRTGEYVCGMALGYLAYSLTQKLQRRGIDIIIFSILEAGAVMIWIYAMYMPIEMWQYRIVHWLLPNCMLLMVFLFGRGIFSRLFSVSILRYLGDISFECFLIHQLVIRQYIACGGAPAISIIGNAFSIIFCVICTVLMAGLISNAKLKNKIN